MKNINKIPVWGTLFLWFLTQPWVMGTPFIQTCEPCFLPKALENLSEHYAVFFSYETKLVNDIEVNFSLNQEESFDDAINRLLKDVGLMYKALNGKYFMIYSDQSSKRNLKRIERKLEQLSTLENKGNLVLYSGLKRSSKEIGVLANGALKLMEMEVTIAGRVVDQDGTPLIGVNILVKGTSIGAVTDVDGSFTITGVEEDATLVLSYIGFHSKEVSIDGDFSNLEIVLLENTQTLDEVVVVGYGTQKKESLTGSVSVIEPKALEKRPITNLATGLQGVSPGLTVTRSTGQPGDEGINIQIRGATSANGNIDPLVVVDGVNSPASVLTTMNPNDVASISVLKDAAAAAIYGAQAAGGVILITTKQGSKGGVNINFSSIISAKKPINMPDRMSLYDEAIFNNIAFENAGAARQYSETDLEYIEQGIPYRINPNDSSRYIYYNQIPHTDYLLRDYATSQQYNVSASGGSEKFRYYMSGSYLDEAGILKYGSNDAKRYNAKLNLDAELNKIFTVRSRLGYTNKIVNEPSSRLSGDYGMIYQISRFRMRNPVLTPEGHYPSSNNTLARLEAGGYRDELENRLEGTFILEAANFVEGLTLKGVFGGQYRRDDDDVFNRTVPLYDRGGIRNYFNQNNSYAITTESRINKNVQLLANYDISIADKHDISALVGFQFEDYRYDGFSASVSNLTSNDLPGLSLGAEETRKNSQSINSWAYQSVFGRINYTYDSRYVIAGSYRFDESSKLAPGYRGQDFWSASAAWNVHNENWFSPVSNLFSIFKVRASWGQLGGSLGFSNFSWANTLINQSGLVLGDSRTTFFYQASIPSATITWENIVTTNFGIELGFLENKILWSTDYYVKKNENMATRVPVPSVLGVAAPRKNIGELKTWGWETEILYRNTIGKSFAYNIGFNLSDSENELIKFENNRSVGPGRRALIEGYPLNTFWGYKTNGYYTNQEEVDAAPFVHPNTGIGDVKYIDLDGDGKISNGNGIVGNSGDLVYIGTDAPRFNFGLNLGFTYKGINFSAFLQGVGKRNFMPGYHSLAPLSQSWRMPMAFHSDFWTPDNPDALYPRPVYQGSYNYLASDKWVLDAGYIRLKNIQLGYTLPNQLTERWLIKNFEVFVTAQDILTFSKMKAFGSIFDPESKNGVVNDYPYFGTASVGVNIKF